VTVCACSRCTLRFGDELRQSSSLRQRSQTPHYKLRANLLRRFLIERQGQLDAPRKHGSFDRGRQLLLPHLRQRWRQGLETLQSHRGGLPFRLGSPRLPQPIHRLQERGLSGLAGEARGEQCPEQQHAADHIMQVCHRGSLTPDDHHGNWRLQSHPGSGDDRRVTRRRIAILGCTGSVGSQALTILAEHAERFEVVLLAAHSSATALAAAAAQHRPQACCLTGSDLVPDLPPGCHYHRGADGLLAALAATEPDTVLNAITGAAGLAASEWTLRTGRTLALANKESLVMAGDHLMRLARQHGARILPVDSEHCAVFQCLGNEPLSAVRRIWLTASGGPFRQRALGSFASITPQEALQHPTWRMGPRITIGSATMMNKAFEVLEAHWLFGLPPERIEVLVHPQSIVHSMVEFCDGSMLAQCGVPDMRVPILYCLGWPERLPFDFAPFDPRRWQRLEFESLEPARYPAVPLAYDVLRLGGDAGAVLNAADEVATAAFLAGALDFPSITATVDAVVRQRPPRPIHTLADVIAADADGRARAQLLLTSRVH